MARWQFPEDFIHLTPNTPNAFVTTQEDDWSKSIRCPEYLWTARAMAQSSDVIY
ncbi:hypothetical protein EXN66_Car022132 [Channa argus]|uniref:Uncharacterized protein n=1 Tax=Channa argus TaxID=215402 RepID=A0A6G1QUQ5_CHAAH|nr:hypothetical protein EXN66_Car022132 [Channa argus]